MSEFGLKALVHIIYLSKVWYTNLNVVINYKGHGFFYTSIKTLLKT